MEPAPAGAFHARSRGRKTSGLLYSGRFVCRSCLRREVGWPVFQSTLADLVAFTLLWSRDPTRHAVFDLGPNVWFWIRAAQTLIFTVITALLLQNTGRVARAAN